MTCPNCPADESSEATLSAIENCRGAIGFKVGSGNFKSQNKIACFAEAAAKFNEDFGSFAGLEVVAVEQDVVIDIRIKRAVKLAVELSLEELEAEKATKPQEAILLKQNLQAI